MKTRAFRSSVLGALALTLFGGAGATTVAAQTGTRIEAGERVRVTYVDHAHAARQKDSEARHAAAVAAWLLLPGFRRPIPNSVRIAGRLVAVSVDSLVVERAAESAPTTVPTASIVQLEVHRLTGRDFLWPTLIGAGVGGVTGAVVAHFDLCFMGCSSGPTLEEVLELAAYGAVAGAVTGAGYRLLHPWRRVRLPMAPTVTADRDGRFALAATVPF